MVVPFVLQVIGVEEAVRVQSLQPLADVDPFQGCVLEESFLEGRHTVGNIDLPQARTAVEGGVDELGHGVGEMNLPQADTALKGQALDALDSIGHGDLGQVPVAAEGALGDHPHRDALDGPGDVQLFRCAGVAGDGDASGGGGIGKVLAVRVSRNLRRGVPVSGALKGAWTDLGNAALKVHVLQSRAARKGPVLHRFQPGGQNNPAQMRAALEGRRLDLGQALRQNDGFQSLLILEGPLLDEAEALGDFHVRGAVRGPGDAKPRVLPSGASCLQPSQLPRRVLEGPVKPGIQAQVEVFQSGRGRRRESGDRGGLLLPGGGRGAAPRGALLRHDADGTEVCDQRHAQKLLGLVGEGLQRPLVLRVLKEQHAHGSGFLPVPVFFRQGVQHGLEVLGGPSAHGWLVCIAVGVQKLRAALVAQEAVDLGDIAGEGLVVLLQASGNHMVRIVLFQAAEDVFGFPLDNIGGILRGAPLLNRGRTLIAVGVQKFLPAGIAQQFVEIGQVPAQRLMSLVDSVPDNAVGVVCLQTLEDAVQAALKIGREPGAGRRFLRRRLGLFCPLFRLFRFPGLRFLWLSGGQLVQKSQHRVQLLQAFAEPPALLTQGLDLSDGALHQLPELLERSSRFSPSRLRFGKIAAGLHTYLRLFRESGLCLRQLSFQRFPPAQKQVFLFHNCAHKLRFLS